MLSRNWYRLRCEVSMVRSARSVIGESRTFSSRMASARERDSFVRGWRLRVSENRFNKVSRSEEHTSELQSRPHLVCRLLLEKKKKKKKKIKNIKTKKRKKKTIKI